MTAIDLGTEIKITPLATGSGAADRLLATRLATAPGLVRPGAKTTRGWSLLPVAA